MYLTTRKRGCNVDIDICFKNIDRLIYVTLIKGREILYHTGWTPFDGMVCIYFPNHIIKNNKHKVERYRSKIKNI